MAIWVDADTCPNPIEDSLFRVAGTDGPTSLSHSERPLTQSQQARG